MDWVRSFIMAPSRSCVMSLTTGCSRYMDCVTLHSPTDHPILSRFQNMFSEEAENLSLNGPKKQFPEEENRWQIVREERRRIQNAGAFSKDKKNAERSRIR